MLLHVLISVFLMEQERRQDVWSREGLGGGGGVLGKDKCEWGMGREARCPANGSCAFPWSGGPHLLLTTLLLQQHCNYLKWRSSYRERLTGWRTTRQVILTCRTIWQHSKRLPKCPVSADVGDDLLDVFFLIWKSGQGNMSFFRNEITTSFDTTNQILPVFFIFSWWHLLVWFTPSTK